jgi:hypothetical protein
VKHFKLIASACSFALLLGAGSASADIVIDASSHPVVVDYPGGLNTNQHQIVGSDTLNEVMDCLTAGLGSACPGQVTQITGINNYVGQGSGQGQRQMEGSPSPGTDELACTVGGATDPNGLPETNPGCQEIAPMSGEMDKGVCDDDVTTPGGTSGNNASAESLAICADAIAVITDNTSLSQYGTAAACPGETGDSSNPPPYQPSPAYLGSGGLRHAGIIPADPATGSAAYTISDWKDVLRLVYTGCENTDGTCDNKDHYLRCTDPVRRTLINHWSYLVDSGALAGDTAQSCGHINCADSTNGTDGGLRAAYRRDDSSGTSGFFLSTLGLNKTTKHRTAFVTAVGKVSAIIPTASTGDMFCDGGDIEGFTAESPAACTANAANACPNYTAPWSSSGFPQTATCPPSGMCPPGPAIGETAPDEIATCTAGATNACRDFLKDNPGVHTLTCPASGTCPLPPVKGDPITKTCASDDILCNSTGRIGVVRALISPSTLGGVAPYPLLQCTSGKYAFKPFINVSVDVCPDGTKPKAGQCPLPYFQILQDPTKPFNATTNPEIGRDYNCLTIASNHTAAETSHMDARAFNYVVRDSNGVVQCLTGAGATCTLPAVAQWRQRMAVLSAGSIKGGTIGTVAGTSNKCQQVDATRLMGCVVGGTQCTIGFAGREVAEDSASTGLQEPFKINDSVGTNANTLGSLSDKGLATPNPADYVFARFLYFGALGGFHNISADCAARGGSAAFCADELALVKEFTDNYTVPGTGGAAVCAATGFIALPASNTTMDNAGNLVDLHECRSSLGSSSTASTCGAPGATRTAFPQDGSIVPVEPDGSAPCAAK